MSLSLSLLRLLTVSFITPLASLRPTDCQIALLRPGNGAANEEEVALLVDLDDPEVHRFEELVDRERVAKQGWTDVARLTSRGAVAVNYGPGEVAQAHQVGESMQIENLSVAYDVMKTLLS